MVPSSIACRTLPPAASSVASLASCGRRATAPVTLIHRHLLVPAGRSPPAIVSAASVRSFGSSGKESFSPRRRPPKTYRPIPTRRVVRPGPTDPNSIGRSLMDNHHRAPHVIGSSDDDNMFDDDGLVEEFGRDGAEVVRHTRREAERAARGDPIADPESFLRVADYVTSASGSTEDLVGERRALMDAWSPSERRHFHRHLDEFIEKERIEDMELGDDDVEEPEDLDWTTPDAGDKQVDPNQVVHGDWSEMIVRVDRVQKVQRGGTMVRYRSLVIGGNTNGCGGFGIGKANSPKEATDAAARMCKRNVFYIDRYRTSGLTRDLVGRHNSCRVVLRAVQPNRGLRGHPLVKDILMYMGVTDCSSKTHGNRNVYNVVRATFKAIMTHESMDEIALKRGKRLFTLERAKRLQI